MYFLLYLSVYPRELHFQLNRKVGIVRHLVAADKLSESFRRPASNPRNSHKQNPPQSSSGRYAMIEGCRQNNSHKIKHV